MQPPACQESGRSPADPPVKYPLPAQQIVCYSLQPVKNLEDPQLILLLIPLICSTDCQLQPPACQESGRSPADPPVKYPLPAQQIVCYSLQPVKNLEDPQLLLLFLWVLEYT